MVEKIECVGYEEGEFVGVWGFHSREFRVLADGFISWGVEAW